MHIVNEIKETIQQALPNAHIIVLDPMEDGIHLEAVVVSSEFEGLSLVKQHQKVMQPLNDHFNRSLHALSLKTLTPEQWEKEKHKYG